MNPQGDPIRKTRPNHTPARLHPYPNHAYPQPVLALSAPHPHSVYVKAAKEAG
jgi:hypothetical protein